MINIFIIFILYCFPKDIKKKRKIRFILGKYYRYINHVPLG